MASLFDSRAPFGSFYGNFSAEEEDRIKTERANQILADQNRQATQSAFEEGYGTSGFPTFPQDNYNLPNVDIQAQAQQMYNQNIMSDLEFQKKLDEERRKTQLMEIFSAMTTGRAPRIVPYSTTPKSGFDAKKSASDSELSLALNLFRDTQPSNASQFREFVKKYKLGPSTEKYLKELFPMYDEGDLKPMYNSNGEIIYRREKADVVGELEGGFTFIKTDAEASGYKNALSVVQQDLNNIFERTGGDINSKDIEKLKLDPKYRNPQYIVALKDLTNGMDLDVNETVFKNLETGQTVRVRDSGAKKYRDNKNFVEITPEMAAKESQRILSQSNINKTVASLGKGGENESLGVALRGLPAQQQKVFLESFIANGTFPGIGPEDLDTLSSALGMGIATMTAENIQMRSVVDAAKSLSDPKNISSRKSNLDSMYEALGNASQGDKEHFDQMWKIFQEANKPLDIKSEQRTVPVMGTDKRVLGSKTVTQSYVMDGDNKIEVGEPVEVVKESDEFVTIKTAEGQTKTVFSDKAFKEDLKLIGKLTEGKDLRLPKLTITYDYGTRPFIDRVLSRDEYSAVDDNLITALLKSRDDSMVTPAEYQLQLEGAGFIERLEVYRNKIRSGARLSAKQRRGAIQVLNDIYMSAYLREKPLFDTRKKAYDKRYGANYERVPFSYQTMFEGEEDKFGVLAALAGVNTSLYKEPEFTPEEIFAKNNEYFNSEDVGSGKYGGYNSVEEWYNANTREAP